MANFLDVWHIGNGKAQSNTPGETDRQKWLVRYGIHTNNGGSLQRNFTKTQIIELSTINIATQTARYFLELEADCFLRGLHKQHHAVR